MTGHATEWWVWHYLAKYAWGALMVNQWGADDPPFLDGTLLESYHLVGPCLHGTTLIQGF